MLAASPTFTSVIVIWCIFMMHTKGDGVESTEGSDSDFSNNINGNDNNDINQSDNNVDVGDSNDETETPMDTNGKFPLETKYWSTRRAREAILKYLLEADSYHYKNGSYYVKTDNTYKKLDWTKNVADFGQNCEFAVNDLRIILRANTTKETVDKLLSRVENYVLDAIKFIHDTIPLKNNEYQTMNKWNNTWKNWYQVSVTFPHLLAVYLLMDNGHRRLNTDTIVTEIKRIITTPRRSLSYNRSDANSVFMFGPWLIANAYIYYNNLTYFKNKVLNGEEYSYVRSVLELGYQTTRFGLGLHRDGTYISHKYVLGVGYLSSLCSSITMYVYAFDSNLQLSPVEKWSRTASLLLHPTVNRGPPGILARNSNFYQAAFPNATIGAEILPLSRILRINTPKGKFIVRGVSEGLGFFEADQDNYLYSQYWVQSRLPFKAKSPTKIPPFEYAYGLIYTDEQKNYVKLKSRTTTTDVFYPDSGSWAVVGRVRNEETFLYQNYSISYFGKYQVREHIRHSTTEANLVRCVMEIDNREGDQNLNIRLCVDRPINPFDIASMQKYSKVFSINKGETLVVEHLIDLDEGNIVSTVGNDLNPPFVPNNKKIQLAYFDDSNDVWVLDMETGVVSSSINGVQSCALLRSDENEKEVIRDGKFRFDYKLNYYTSSSRNMLENNMLFQSSFEKK